MQTSQTSSLFSQDIEGRRSYAVIIKPSLHAPLRPAETESMTKVTRGKEMCREEEKEKKTKYQRTYLPQLPVSVSLAMSDMELFLASFRGLSANDTKILTGASNSCSGCCPTSCRPSAPCSSPYCRATGCWDAPSAKGREGILYQLSFDPFRGCQI